MKLRSCTKADLAELHQLEVAVFGSHVYPDFFFRQALDLWPDSLLLAADDNGALLGYALGAPGDEPGDVWLLSLAVSSQARGLGLGKALCQQLLRQWQQQGHKQAKLTVHPDNGAVSLYQKLGFAVTGQEDDYFGANEPRLVMTAELAPGIS